MEMTKEAGQNAQEKLPHLENPADILDNALLVEKVREGISEFDQFMAVHGTTFPWAESLVQENSAGEIKELQSRIISISSINHPNEIADKAFLICAIHVIDDYIDNPAMSAFYGGYEKLLSVRTDIQKAMEALGGAGQIAKVMEEYTLNREAMYKGVHRVLYGGLIPQTQDPEMKQKLLEEYRELVFHSVNPAFVEAMREIPIETYAITDKASIELHISPEADFDFTVAEIWNVVFAPLLYYQNIASEEKAENGKLSERIDSTSVEKMVSAAAPFIDTYPDARHDLRMLQLEVVLQKFKPFIPENLFKIYSQIISQRKA